MKRGRKLIDIAGQQFGAWTVIGYAGNYAWRCLCTCGTEAVVQGGSLRGGRSKSCRPCSPKRGGPIPDMQRRAEISTARANGLTLREVGEQFGISKQRVHQIVSREERAEAACRES